MPAIKVNSASPKSREDRNLTRGPNTSKVSPASTGIINEAPFQSVMISHEQCRSRRDLQPLAPTVTPCKRPRSGTCRQSSNPRSTASATPNRADQAQQHDDEKRTLVHAAATVVIHATRLHDARPRDEQERYAAR